SLPASRIWQTLGWRREAPMRAMRRRRWRLSGRAKRAAGGVLAGAGQPRSQGRGGERAPPSPCARFWRGFCLPEDCRTQQDPATRSSGGGGLPPRLAPGSAAGARDGAGIGSGGGAEATQESLSGAEALAEGAGTAASGGKLSGADAQADGTRSGAAGGVALL